MTNKLLKNYKILSPVDGDGGVDVRGGGGGSSCGCGVSAMVLRMVVLLGTINKILMFCLN